MSARERGIATNIAGFNMRVNTGRVRDGNANPLPSSGAHRMKSVRAIEAKVVSARRVMRSAEGSRRRDACRRSGV
jgi:hypothetical protein